MRIFVDFEMSERAGAVFREATAGHEVISAENRSTSVLAAGAIDPRVGDAEVVFGQPDPEALMASNQLRWVQVSSAGITRYDNAAFRGAMGKAGVAVTNSSDVYAEACAVHVLGFLLAQVRVLPRALGNGCENGSDEWNGLRADCGTLRADRILVVGYGAIGRRLVELLRPFGAEVVAFRRRARGDEGVRVVATDEDVEVELGRADHVVNILPASAETGGFFDAKRLGAIKRGAAFYNIGRGTTVDQVALEAALRSGALGAAWLDVTEPEPLDGDHPLRSVGNCHITPHIAGGRGDETLALVEHFAANLRRFVAGEALANRVI